MELEVGGLTIFPTGTCFDDALEWLTELVKRSPLRGFTPNLFLCHGICLMHGIDPYSHAWVEEFGMVWFSGVIEEDKAMIKCDLKEFYDHFHVTEQVTKYTPWQAVEQNHAAENYGPWEQRYIDLTREGKQNEEKAKDI